MSTPLNANEKADYTRIIDGILATADLQTVTRKKVRQGLESALGRNLNSQKDAIKRLIEDRFDAISSETQAMPTPPSASAPETSPKHQTNGHAINEVDADADADVDIKTEPEADADADGEIEVNTQPLKKKLKREGSSEDADARLAAELQAQEDKLSRGRTTRGGGATKVKKPKSKAPKKKSAKRVRDDDDSDAASDSGSGAKGSKRKAGGGFQKPFNLSYALQELCGETQLSRPQVVKKLWEHIKANDLQDPKDKRQIRCDEKMQAVFKQSRVDMFQMNKLLGNQLYPLDEE